MNDNPIGKDGVGYSQTMPVLFPKFVMEGLEVEVFMPLVGDRTYSGRQGCWLEFDGQDWVELEWTFGLRVKVWKANVRGSRVVRRLKKVGNLRYLRVTCSPRRECDCW